MRKVVLIVLSSLFIGAEAYGSEAISLRVWADVVQGITRPNGCWTVQLPDISTPIQIALEPDANGDLFGSWSVSDSQGDSRGVFQVSAKRHSSSGFLSLGASISDGTKVVKNFSIDFDNGDELIFPRVTTSYAFPASTEGCQVAILRLQD